MVFRRYFQSIEVISVPSLCSHCHVKPFSGISSQVYYMDPTCLPYLSSLFVLSLSHYTHWSLSELFLVSPIYHHLH